MGDQGSMWSVVHLSVRSGLSLFELSAENKVGGISKDVHKTEIPRLTHKPGIKDSSAGGCVECPGFSGKDIKGAIYFINL